MASTLEYPVFNALIEDIMSTPHGNARKSGVNKAVTYLTRANVIDIWAETICNRFGYRDPNGREDIRSVIAEKIIVTLHTADSSRSGAINNWVDFLFGLSRNAVRDYLSSGSVTVASGMSSAARRHSSVLASTRELTVKLKREPTKQEIIDYANEHLHATRKDPRKQGALLSMADFGGAATPSASVEDALWVEATTHTMTEMEDKVESSLAAQELRRQAEEMFPGDPHLQRVADVWMQLSMDGERPTTIVIANATGFSRTQVRASQTRLDEVLQALRDKA